MLLSKTVNGIAYKLSKSIEDEYIITYNNSGSDDADDGDGDIEVFKTDDHTFAMTVWEAWLERYDEFKESIDVYEWMGHEFFQSNPHLPSYEDLLEN
jgi:hypothetical protein